MTDGSAHPAPVHTDDVAELSAEDAKLIILARGAQGRAGTPTGAAVRDDDGRTYAAAAVDLPSLALTALQAAVAIAVSSGATGLEAAVVVGARDGLPVDDASVAVARDLGTRVVWRVDPAGTVVHRLVL